MIKRASLIPGPGEYTPTRVARRGSLKFSEFSPKSEIDMAIYPKNCSSNYTNSGSYGSGLFSSRGFGFSSNYCSRF